MGEWRVVARISIRLIKGLADELDQRSPSFTERGEHLDEVPCDHLFLGQFGHAGEILELEDLNQLVIGVESPGGSLESIAFDVIG